MVFCSPPGLTQQIEINGLMGVLHLRWQTCHFDILALKNRTSRKSQPAYLLHLLGPCMQRKPGAHPTFSETLTAGLENMDLASTCLATNRISLASNLLEASGKKPWPFQAGQSPCDAISPSGFSAAPAAPGAAAWRIDRKKAFHRKAVPLGFSKLISHILGLGLLGLSHRG